MDPTPRQRIVWITFWFAVSSGMWAVIIWGLGTIWSRIVQGVSR